jgi:Flp pilus assembly protein TadD
MNPAPDTLQAAFAAAQAGDYPLAISIARELLARNPRDANALQVLGLAYGRQGRNAEALDAFLKADALFGNNPAVLNSIGVLLKERGDLNGARAYLEKASRFGLIEAHYNLAATLSSLGERALAQASYETAIKANPKSAEALGRFAKFLESAHQLDRARELAERAVAISPANAAANMTLAELDVRLGDHAAVVERLQRLMATSRQSPVDAAILFGMLSRAFEKLGRYGESFDACAKANDLQHAYYGERIVREQSPRSPQNVERLIAFFEALDPGAWSAHDGLEGPAPVFLLGFPRSGTTLLDQILTSHGVITVIEEKENMVDAWAEMIIPEHGLARLASLSRDEINRFRAAYWSRIQSHAGATPAGKIVVDKLPLDTALLGLIYRLFPEAKVIFALRDPRDVVLSCFQQTFAMNAAMYQFLKLDTAARYYDRVMHLGRLCRAKLPLAIHEVRYENVANDLRAEIEPLLSFLGLNWSDAIERYYETARARVIRTPSAKQVIEKPYQSSIGKWRHYEKQMAPVLPMLEPWVQEFGYPSFPIVPAKAGTQTSDGSPPSRG